MEEAASCQLFTVRDDGDKNKNRFAQLLAFLDIRLDVSEVYDSTWYSNTSHNRNGFQQFTPPMANAPHCCLLLTLALLPPNPRYHVINPQQLHNPLPLSTMQALPSFPPPPPALPHPPHPPSHITVVLCRCKSAYPSLSPSRWTRRYRH